jgi:hypothetical protein
MIGQDMLKEAVNEIFGSQFAIKFLPRICITISKGDPIIFQFQNTIVANSHPKNVGSQILQCIQPRPDRLTMHHPLLLPNFGWNTGIATCAFQGVSESKPPAGIK